MSEEPWSQMVRDDLDKARAAGRRGDGEAARYHLSQAADAAGELEDDESRRHAWSTVAKGAVKLHDPELSQVLARKLIRLDRRLGHTGWVITDVLTYGSSLHLSGQHLEAEEAYRQAFDLAVAIESWQRAAAAASNVAAAIAARRELKDAQEWAERALGHLRREPDLDTEVRTRALLIQIRHARGEPPATCLAKARALLDEHGAELADGLRQVLRRALDPVLDSFFAGRPDLRPSEWVEQHFPELMEERHG